MSIHVKDTGKITSDEAELCLINIWENVNMFCHNQKFGYIKVIFDSESPAHKHSAVPLKTEEFHFDSNLHGTESDLNKNK